MNILMISLTGMTAMLAACSSPAEQAQDKAEDRIENVADNSAAMAGSSVLALGMTERQFLDAELVDARGTELADVVAVVRGPGGAPEKLLVEIEDSNPDKFVHVPLDGLKPKQDGDDWDLVTTMTKAQLDALPAVSLTASGAAN